MEHSIEDLLLIVKNFSAKLQILGGKKVELLDVQAKLNDFKYVIITHCVDQQTTKILSQNILEFAKEQHLEVQKVDGEFKGDWIILDFEEFIVHILTEHSRNKFNLEKLWKNKKNQIKF